MFIVDALAYMRSFTAEQNMLQHVLCIIQRVDVYTMFGSTGVVGEIKTEKLASWRLCAQVSGIFSMNTNRTFVDLEIVELDDVEGAMFVVCWTSPVIALFDDARARARRTAAFAVEPNRSLGPTEARLEPRDSSKAPSAQYALRFPLMGVDVQGRPWHALFGTKGLHKGHSCKQHFIPRPTAPPKPFRSNSKCGLADHLRFRMFVFVFESLAG